MKKSFICLCLIFTFFLLSLTITSTASAVVRYTYTGNTFTNIENGTSYNTTMSVSGWFEMSNPIPPNTPLTDFKTLITAYSFFDGVQTHTNDNSAFTDQTGYSDFATDANGNITNWSLFMGSPVPATLGNQAQAIYTANSTDQGYFGPCNWLDAINVCFGFGLVERGYNSGNPGTWTMQIIPDSVPTVNEWGMIIFMALAGLGSVYYLRRKKIKG